MITTRITGSEFGEQIQEDLITLNTNPHLVWDEVKISGQDEGIQCHKTIVVDEDSSRSMLRVSGVLECPASVVFDILMHPEEEAEWNEGCQLGRVIEQYDANHAIVYYKYVNSLPGSSAEVCAVRRSCVVEEYKKYVLAYRSVEHPKVPMVEGTPRLDVKSSGWIIEALPTDPHKTKAYFFGHAPEYESDFLKEGSYRYVTRLLPGLRKYISRAKLDMNSQYLTRAIDTAYRDIYSVFLERSEGTDWKQIFKENNIALFTKRTPSRHVMCTTGIMTMDASPKLIIDSIAQKSFDPLITLWERVEILDENHCILHTAWKSPADQGEFDSLVLQSKRACPGGVYSLLTRSVVHAKVPVDPKRLRVELLPTAYFAHPLNGGKQTLFSYCVQLDMLAYGDRFKEEELLQLMVMRNLSILNNIKVQVKKLQMQLDEKQVEMTPEAKKAKKLEMVSQLCNLLVSQYDERERLRQQLRNLKEAPLPVQIELDLRKRKIGSSYSLIAEDSEEDVAVSYPLSPSDTTLLPSLATNKPLESRKKAFSVFIQRCNEIANSTQQYNSLIDYLPNEVLLNIFKRLDYLSLNAMSQVSKKFKFIASDESLWKNLYDNTWHDMADTQVEFDWRNTFKGKVVLMNNWVKGKFTTKVLQGHQKSVRCIRFDNEVVISGSSDKTVKVWSIQTGECLRTLTGPNAGVLSITLEGTQAKVGYRNGVIRNWDVYTGNCIWEKQYNYWSEGFHFIGSNLISWDSTVDVWDFDTGARKHSFNQHTKKVNCVDIGPGGKTAASGSADKTVIRYDLEAQKVTHIFRGHTTAVQAITLDHNFVVSGSNDRVICLWDIRANAANPVNTLKGHVCPIKCLAVDDYKIVSGAGDNTIRVWDKRNGQCIQRLEEHQSPVLCLQFHEKLIASGSNDGTVLLWDFGLGKSSRTV